MEKQRSSTRGGTRPRTTAAVESDAGLTLSAADHQTEGSGAAQSPSGESQQGGIVSKVRERATAQLSSQKGRATEGLDTIAQAVRHTTQQLRAENHGTVAEYIDKAAEQLEQLSHRLRDKDVNELLQDARQLARRQPAVFIAGSFALGLLTARFIKSSQQDGQSAYRHEDESGFDRYNSGAY
jgi:hypothetical protein